MATKVSCTTTEITRFHWAVIALGLWAIPSGFVTQRLIVGQFGEARDESSRFTPLTRWRAGNMVRLASATSVSLWGLILRASGGPSAIAYTLIAIGGLLVLTWRPSTRPADNVVQRS